MHSQCHWFDTEVDVCDWEFIACNDENKIKKIKINIPKQSCGLFNDEQMKNLSQSETFIIENGNLGLQEMKATNWLNNLEYIDVFGSTSIKSINFGGMSQTNVDYVT